MLNYNRPMTSFFRDPDLLQEEHELFTLPRSQHWTGAQIHRFLEDMKKQADLARHLDIPMEAKIHYRDLFTRLIKTYGH